jgi:hypothetical protein
MLGKPTMLSHQRNQDNNSLGQSWALASQQLPGNHRDIATTLALLGLTLILRGT